MNRQPCLCRSYTDAIVHRHHKCVGHSRFLCRLGVKKTVLVSESVGAVTDLILNAILIPLYGAAGAAIGTLAAEFAVLVVQYIALRSEVRGAFLDIHYFKIFAALIPAVLSAVWVSHLQIGTFWLLVFAAVLFFGLYGIVLLLLKEPLIRELLFGTTFKLTKNKADDVAVNSVQIVPGFYPLPTCAKCDTCYAFYPAAKRLWTSARRSP